MNERYIYVNIIKFCLKSIVKIDQIDCPVPVDRKTLSYRKPSNHRLKMTWVIQPGGQMDEVILIS